jgi:hypothetical protein
MDDGGSMFELPSWMQLGISFVVFVAASFGAVWGYFNRHRRPTESVGGDNDEEILEYLKKICENTQRIGDNTAHTYEYIQKNTDSVERLLRLLEEQRRNENVDRIFRDRLNEAIPEILRQAQDRRGGRT